MTPQIVQEINDAFTLVRQGNKVLGAMIESIFKSHEELGALHSEKEKRISVLEAELDVMKKDKAETLALLNPTALEVES